MISTKKSVLGVAKLTTTYVTDLYVELHVADMFLVNQQSLGLSKNSQTLTFSPESFKFRFAIKNKN